jgi:magnesium transporter
MSMTAVRQRGPAKNGRRNAPQARSASRDPRALSDDRDGQPGRLRVRRFDADRRDREISFDEGLARKPSERQLMWFDIVGENDAAHLEALAKRYELDEQTRRALEAPRDQAQLAVHGSYFRATVAVAPAKRGAAPIWLHLVAGRNVVISRHAAPIDLLDEIDDRIKSDASLGAVEAAEFVALLLDGVVTSYFSAVDAIEDAIDELDARSLRDDRSRPVLDDLIELRRGIARLRRIVTRHRSLFPALAGPDLRQVVQGADAIADLQAVATRYEAAVEAIESSREALLGSFDVYMTRTAQRTNEVMKVLTVATVLLLPGSVIAGLLGMNVVVPLNKDDPMSFWLVVAGVVLLAVIVVGTVRARRWV